MAGIRDTGCYQVFADPEAACAGAHLGTTDVWTSMGYEVGSEARRQAFVDWCVDADRMAVAQPDALSMHCLPAHHGEEAMAEKRMHVQQVLMETCCWAQSGGDRKAPGPGRVRRPGHR